MPGMMDRPTHYAADPCAARSGRMIGSDIGYRLAHCFSLFSLAAAVRAMLARRASAAPRTRDTRRGRRPSTPRHVVYDSYCTILHSPLQ